MVATFIISCSVYETIQHARLATKRIIFSGVVIRLLFPDSLMQMSICIIQFLLGHAQLTSTVTEKLIAEMCIHLCCCFIKSLHTLVFKIISAFKILDKAQNRFYFHAQIISIYSTVQKLCVDVSLQAEIDTA